jgi:DNA helicase-2/ATP-dependent DNA helicase PcrA
MDLNKLNDKQKEAILYTDGPLLILAGAGSGKTKVLTYKVAYLIDEKNVSPYNILAITFTNKAANEMKERIHSLVGDLADHIQISTFHSFGLKIVRENYKLLGYQSNFTIIDADDSVSVIKKILKELDLDPKFYNPNNIKNKISGAKNEMMGPNEYEKYANTEFEKIVVKIYQKYSDRLIRSNSLDFDDLLLLPIRLFKEYPYILQQYQERYKYILIDEYQDTNEVQYILSKMISAKYKNICVVGDNDQAIYSWRGANYKNILNFESDYENTKVILLEENYRSTQMILDAANNVIKNNKYRKDKNLWCTNDKGIKIKYFRANDEEKEAEYVINEIKRKVNEDKLSYDDIVVLYRTNAQSRILEEKFLKAHLPYRVVGSLHFYDRKEIKDLMSYLKLIYNDKDDESLQRIINVPKRGIGQATVDKLSHLAIENNQSMYETINFGKELEFKKIIEELKQLNGKTTLTELVEAVLDKTGMKQGLESEKSIEADTRLENLEEFKSITKSFEESKGIVSLEDFLAELALVSDISEHKESKENISLMTIHSVKGLEFDTVFIVGLEEGLFPHINCLIDSSSLEEERRLCYVGITRAKKELHFVNARRRMLYGRDQVNPPSRFINEVGEEFIECKEEINNKQEITINKEEMLYEADINYNVGDKVIHNEFGEGIVVEVTNTLLTIAFSHQYGIKKFIKNHKSIKKI